VTVSSIDVVLPVLDERDALPSVLVSLPSGFVPIVVDNGSTDGSGAVARSLGALVVDEPRRGFGAACYAGLLAARTDIVCFMDCDASCRGGDLPRLAWPVAEGVADLVVGARRPTSSGAFPLHARIANRALAALARRRSGSRLRDLGPMRAARRDDLLALDLADRRSGWPFEMVLRAAAEGWRIASVDVAYEPRIGRSKVTGTARGAACAVIDAARVHRSTRRVGTHR
jgi:glycosyltransferase involved in cell wall biosynthesis